MTSNPLFSIILPTYNRVSFLERAIQSVCSQTFTHWELWVMDDGSTDGTESMVLALGDTRIHYVKLSHGERSQARNLGIQNATGKYICFLDDDDTYGENYLLRFYEYYEKDDFPDIILRTGYHRITGNTSKKTEWYHEKKHKNPVRFAAFHFCGVWSLSIPREFLKEDLFPVEFPHWQDTHLILRLLARHPFIQLQDSQYHYHLHPEMGSRKMGLDIEKKLSLNLAPIEHFFTHYGDVVRPFLPSDTQKYLIAKKFLEFAQVALERENMVLTVKYFQESLRHNISLKFWRHYLSLFRQLIHFLISKHVLNQI